MLFAPACIVHAGLTHCNRRRPGHTGSGLIAMHGQYGDAQGGQDHPGGCSVRRAAGCAEDMVEIGFARNEGMPLTWHCLSDVRVD